MYKISYRMIRSEYACGICILLWGLIMTLFGGLGLFESGLKQKLLMDSEIKADNIEIMTNDFENKVIYYYMVNEKQYNCAIKIDDNDISISKVQNKNTIYYESKNLANCLSEYELFEKINLALFAFLGIFLSLIVPGIIIIFRARKNVKK